SPPIRTYVQLDLDSSTRTGRLRLRDRYTGFFDESTEPFVRIGYGYERQPICASGVDPLLIRFTAAGHLTVRSTENADEGTENRRALDIALAIAELNGNSALGNRRTHASRLLK